VDDKWFAVLCEGEALGFATSALCSEMLRVPGPSSERFPATSVRFACPAYVARGFLQPR
jgi:hypothetical protein